MFNQQELEATIENGVLRARQRIAQNRVQSAGRGLWFLMRLGFVLCYLFVLVAVALPIALRAHGAPGGWLTILLGLSLLALPRLLRRL